MLTLLFCNMPIIKIVSEDSSLSLLFCCCYTQCIENKAVCIIPLSDQSDSLTIRTVPLSIGNEMDINVYCSFKMCHTESICSFFFEKLLEMKV